MKVKFLVAEEIRPEVGGKLTILGLFPDDNIRLIKQELPEGTPPETPMGLERLAFMISVSGLSKKLYKFKGVIIDPSGEVYKSESKLGEIRSEKGASHILILEMKPFIIKAKGIYHFNFYVNKEMFAFPFEIREQSQQNIG